VCWPVPFSELGTADYSSFVPTAILVTGPYTGGWGMGHLMTRSYARLRFRVLEQRSVEGTVAIVVFGMLFSYALLAVFSWTIYAASPSALSLTSIELLVAVAIASMVTAAVEVLSPAIYDNFLIPLSVFIVILILGHLGVFGFSVLNL
jgi:dolichol kinase